MAKKKKTDPPRRSSSSTPSLSLSCTSLSLFLYCSFHAAINNFHFFAWPAAVLLPPWGSAFVLHLCQPNEDNSIICQLLLPCPAPFQPLFLASLKSKFRARIGNWWRIAWLPRFGGWFPLVLCDHRVICSRTSSLDSENLLGVKWVPVRRALSHSILI